MSHSDPIADLLTRIRNAGMICHRFVDIPWSNLKENIAKLLKKEGFVESYLVKKEQTQGTIRIFLKYTEARKPLIRGLERISKPSVRHYKGYKEIKPVLGGMGISIMSTSQGVMTGKEARNKKIGGELLCQVW
jgi:small subunit ribosomal protein S8